MIDSSSDSKWSRSKETITSWFSGSKIDKLWTSPTTIELISRHGIMKETVLTIPALPIALQARRPIDCRNPLLTIHPSSFVSFSEFLESADDYFETHLHD